MTKTKWIIDQGHSEIQFKVKHLAIANVTGAFRLFNGTILTESDSFENAKVSLEIQTGSLDSNNTERDKHLRSDIFLNSELFPTIKFEGELTRKGQYMLAGNITILETTREVVLEVEHTGIGKGRFNDTRAGFELTGKIRRHDFGLNFNLLTDVGSLVVGEDIKISASIELIRVEQ